MLEDRLLLLLFFFFFLSLMVLESSLEVVGVAAFSLGAALAGWSLMLLGSIVGFAGASVSLADSTTFSGCSSSSIMSWMSSMLKIGDL